MGTTPGQICMESPCLICLNLFFTNELGPSLQLLGIFPLQCFSSPILPDKGWTLLYFLLTAHNFWKSPGFLWHKAVLSMEGPNGSRPLLEYFLIGIMSGSTGKRPPLSQKTSKIALISLQQSSEFFHSVKTIIFPAPHQSIVCDFCFYSCLKDQ